METYEDNPYGWTLEEFANELYCLDDVQDSLLDGSQAILCRKATAFSEPVPVVVAEHGGRFLAIQSSSRLSEEEFEATIQSFKFIE